MSRFFCTRHPVTYNASTPAERLCVDMNCRDLGTPVPSSDETAFMPDKLKKVPSGINGLDEITGGGLPAGRPTPVIGGPGSGKTLLGTSFLVRGATSDGEPGVHVSSDERPADLEATSRSLGFNLAGDYDLEGLFIRLAHAVDTIGARRVLLDSLDTLFATLIRFLPEPRRLAIGDLSSTGALRSLLMVD